MIFSAVQRRSREAAMTPAASVSGLYFAHPEARYFTVGRVGPDQAADYAVRKGMPVAEVKRWLSTNLAESPVDTSPLAATGR